MEMHSRKRRVEVWMSAVAILAAAALLTGCPKEENPYAKECQWMAGDADECWDLASGQGCVSHKYDPRSLACLGVDCINCDVTGVSCPRECSNRGLGSNGYRETSKQACIDRIQELVYQGKPARGGYLSDAQCCCLPS